MSDQNVLIVAGIVFLGVAAVGKVSGKIEPSTAGRVLLGLLGIVFFTGGIVAHVWADREDTEPVADVPRGLSPFARTR